MDSVTDRRHSSPGFPHSGIPGSRPACGFPRLIAACYALHRLLMPRHPPYTLSNLTSFTSDTHDLCFGLFSCQRTTSPNVGLNTNLGGAERDRTADPLVANQVLSQLSYSPLSCMDSLRSLLVSWDARFVATRAGWPVSDGGPR